MDVYLLDFRCETCSWRYRYYSVELHNPALVCGQCEISPTTLRVTRAQLLPPDPRD